jgi:hypothetical protein
MRSDCVLERRTFGVGDPRAVALTSAARVSGVTVGKKLLTYAVVGFLIFFVAYRPAAAATVAKFIGTTLSEIANGFGNFFAGLVA